MKDYTTFKDGTSRGSQETLNYVVEKAEPIIQIVRENQEVSIALLILIGIIVVTGFLFIVFNKLKSSGSDL